MEGFSPHPVKAHNIIQTISIIAVVRFITTLLLRVDYLCHALIINTTVSICLGAAGQIKRLVFDPLVHPNEGMGNSPVPVRVETVG